MNVDLHHGGATDVGRVRDTNQDAYAISPPVFVVADGMGGHSGGDVASQIVVEEFARLSEGLDPQRGGELVADSLGRAQARLLDYTQRQRASDPTWHAGTTAVVAVLVEEAGDPSWLVANLGDSRAYRWSDGQLTQVSVDHSVVQELVNAGYITEQEAAVHPERHVITRALGSAEGIHPDFFTLPVLQGDRLLLCTDGINGMIDDEVIAKVLTEVPDAQDAADTLVVCALAAGGHDNATAVVIDVVGRA